MMPSERYRTARIAIAALCAAGALTAGAAAQATMSTGVQNVVLFMAPLRTAQVGRK